MSRKNTILIAVLINTGLLAILFITAVTMQEPKIDEIQPKTSYQLKLPELEQPLIQQEMALEKGDEDSLKETDLKPLYQLPEFIAEKEPPQVEPALEKETASAAPVHVPALPPAQIGELIVKKGDTLEKIARAHRTSVDAILQTNHLSSTFLKVGQSLKIPKAKEAKVSEKTNLSSEPQYYTIKVGENPWAIAKKHQIKVQELLKLNGLNEDKARKLKPGDRLRVR